MEPYRSIPLDWGNPGSAYNEQSRSGFRFSRNLVPVPFNIGTVYQTQFQNGMADNAQADIIMDNNEPEEQPARSALEAQPARAQSSRARSAHLDWDSHKDRIKDLYIDKNKSLPETMKAMDEVYFFKASEKLYKNKFKEWNWQKNLSAEKAHFMMNKSQQRKREEGKNTVFSYGGRLWNSERVENTLSRAKKAGFSNDVATAETPESISYETPQTQLNSPSPINDAADFDVEAIGNPDDNVNDFLGDPTNRSCLGGRKLALTWQGHSRADLQDMWRTALASRDRGGVDEAENMLHQVSLGLSHVLGMTNEDTIKAAYNLADLYAGTGRMEKAVDMIETVIQNHIDTYGYEDKRTQQNILHAVELLNGWNREADALGLLSLSKELLHSSQSLHNARTVDSQANKNEKVVQMPHLSRSRSDLSRIIQPVSGYLSSVEADHGLRVARTHVAAKDGAAESLLLTMISQCENRPDLLIQHLKAQAELLKLYEKTDQTDVHELAFVNALKLLNEIWKLYTWDEDETESFDFMEAVLQLIANLLKSGYRDQAKRNFRTASEKACEVFGSDDERTVWALITIGLVYQTHMTWYDAEEWFEGAFAAALANKEWGPKDGIVMSLQNAMDHHHFSYVSDKGRPFKTVFGVSGIKIRPGRLHLE